MSIRIWYRKNLLKAISPAESKCVSSLRKIYFQLCLLLSLINYFSRYRYIFRMQPDMYDETFYEINWSLLQQVLQSQKKTNFLLKVFAKYFNLKCYFLNPSKISYHSTVITYLGGQLGTNCLSAFLKILKLTE